MNPVVAPYTTGVAVPDDDEDLMRRFIVGDLNAVEREQIERRFFEDSAYFEAICALEDAMLLAHLRPQSPDAWQDRFAASIRESPARQRRLAEMTRLLQAVDAASPSHAPAPPVVVRARPLRRVPWFGLSLAAAAASVILAGVLLRWHSQVAPAQSLVETAPSQALLQATFVLLPGPTRSDGQQANTLRLLPGTRDVRLQATVDAEAPTPVHARLQLVGGETIVLPDVTTGRATAGGLEISWIVPAARLSRGDYLLTLEVEGSNGTRETIASRFFSVVE
jgi:hypothetical protein